MSNRTLTLLMGVVAFLILAVGVIAIAIFAGGGGDDNGTPSFGDTPPETPRNTPSGGICSGDRLITFGSDPATTLDPIQVRDEGTAEYVLEIFGGLVTLDPALGAAPAIA